jgi:hypothetical protein
MLNFSTPYGKYYKVNSKGHIYYDGLKPSGQWLFLGLQRVNSNEVIPFAKITPELLKTLQVHYKNGRPRYTVRDLDHGTVRVWGNTHYHGVGAIWFE